MIGFRIPERKTHEYRYVCTKCKDDAWYVVELPEHMHVCFGKPGIRGCGGKLMLAETRPIPVDGSRAASEDPRVSPERVERARQIAERDLKKPIRK